MKKQLSRKDELLLLLKAISLPLLVIEITAYNRKWKPLQYSELQLLIEEELKTLS